MSQSQLLERIMEIDRLGALVFKVGKAFHAKQRVTH